VIRKKKSGWFASMAGWRRGLGLVAEEVNLGLAGERGGRKKREENGTCSKNVSEKTT
jgi:hypothetical protein